MYNLGNTYELKTNQLIEKFKVTFKVAGETTEYINNLLKDGKISIDEYNLLNNRLKDETIKLQEKQKSIIIK